MSEPAIVVRGWTYIPELEVPPRQMRCAGCKGRIKLLTEYVLVCTDGGRHYWHPNCYDRKPRRHLTSAQYASKMEIARHASRRLQPQDRQGHPEEARRRPR